MKLRQEIILLLLILVINSYYNFLFAQNIQVKSTRQSSFEAFSSGNYEKAYREFTELLVTYSKDPLYKYYSGVCLVKMNRDPDEAVTFLEQALQGAVNVKILPSDALFYLGRAQQMSGKFMEAVTSFNLYIDQVGKKTARELFVPEFIQQCNNKKGALKEPSIKENEVVKNKKDEIGRNENDPVVKVSYPQPVMKDTLEKNKLPDSYEKILDEALESQFKADSLNKLVGEQKKELDKLAIDDKLALKLKISENELLAASFQKAADQKYGEAQIAMNPEQSRIIEKEIVQVTDKKVIKDSVQSTDNIIIKAKDNHPESENKIVQEANKPVEAYKSFEVLTRPVSDPKEKIIINPEVPDGLIYRIQIAVFRNPVAPAYFKGITPVYGFKVAGSDRTNYFAGMFRRSSDASKALSVVKAKGFKDAFVVAFSGNKPVSSDRAAILEKEWGKKPFKGMDKIIPETLIDTLPPTLSFKVEVIRSLKPLKNNVLEEIKKIAGSRGLDIQPLDNGNIVYLIGKFITFESATEYADLLLRNGYREARVVAWLGDKEIPVETAKQLFDNLE